MDEIKIPKDHQVLVADTKFERWVKMIGVFVTGLAAMFGVQKMPAINDSTKISEAVQVVKNLTPEELAGLRGMQFASLEKQMQTNQEINVAAMEALKTEMKSSLKDYDERTAKRLDKHGELILINIRAISRLEVLIPKARASN